MDTSYAYSAYKSHDLNIAMRTSSGDIIKMDFANESSFSMSHSQNSNGSKDTMSFASMQSFQFSIDTNGIDEQDKKEIDAFMKIAQPFIDNFLKELKDNEQKSPVSKLANKIASIFEPNRQRDDNEKNQVKTNIVDMFDNSVSKLKDKNNIDKIFKDVENLLEKTLKAFDEFNKILYA
ncbi:MAG: hypothetical protein A2513_09185 [Sulfurimonas sp. RIFOXYD12_FULL_33_39]|uniref:hypothetical protein n=1 Tax=unclassified Sulfurimonas TaxID=2623549 RepID=UPI0008CAD871|nr:MULTISPECIES: hypothetical protein [unclassified Sulfurimonas]OHE07408.1 MAG: hypothetical protein A3G74_01780 [Sulfurimonas sp. RIFCSPLOWO2_12_FULL_34_6]OHE10250.1 MAG: hypothetical protein A2513_09185 [Sulfurimonas sp. RIFOXYD12_FULL_33_39]OHE14529.1 MAG: hypothetical protein A2530_01295 [Sulfurimonas sp. RIFOXYD2_FULL_34_21]DAB27923.1 MAG TPA: hypothetical protein CFH78_05275 [Sulfurimonas sp. UBA10385]